MSLTMHIYSKKDDTSQGWDVSEIVHDIEYTTSILGQPGKLTFVLEKDMYDSGLQISVGSLVKFWHSDDDSKEENPVFMGNVFTIGTDRSEAYRIVAYDSLRYLQNHQDMVIPERENELEYFFNEIVGFEFEEAERKIINWNNYIKGVKIRGNVFTDESSFNILQFCMDDYATNSQLKITAKNFNMISNNEIKQTYFKPKFYIRDNFGTIELREIFTDFIYNDDGTEKDEFLIIGNESLLTNYQYEVDIDKNTFNEFYLMYNKKDKQTDPDTNKQVKEKSMIMALQAGTVIEKTNTKLDGQTIGDDTIPKWGKLRKIVTLNDSTIDGNAENYIKEMVQLFNQPTRSMKLSALGYDGLYAGGSFIFKLDKLKINYPVYVLSATHHYGGDSHTMELEVNVNPKMEMFV